MAPRHTSRRALLATLACSLCALAQPNWAQTPYPSQPVRIVAAGAPGGGMDLLARLIGEHLQRELGQPVIVDNRPGGQGVIAAKGVISAAPDGHTLLMTAASFTVISQAMSAKPAYDVTRDLTPVAQIGLGGVFLAVNASFPATTMKELMSRLKAEPGKHSYASFGEGSSGHLMMAALAQQTGIDVNHVPYKGMQQILADLTAGTVPIGFVDVASSLPLIRAGKIRALAVSGSARMPASPNVPTMTEQGYRFDTDGWFALFAPKGTPAPIALRLNQAVNQAMAAPEMKARLLQLNMAAAPQKTPAQFAQTVQADLLTWQHIVRTNRLAGF